MKANTLGNRFPFVPAHNKAPEVEVDRDLSEGTARKRNEIYPDHSQILLGEQGWLSGNNNLCNFYQVVLLIGENRGLFTQVAGYLLFLQGRRVRRHFQKSMVLKCRNGQVGSSSY